MINFCKLRDIQKALNTLEERFREEHGICLNEGAILCQLHDCCMTSSDISRCIELKASHTSKTIRSLEDKGLITRKVGKIDKRVMKFILSTKGKQTLENIRLSDIETPDNLRPLINEK